MFYFHSWFLCGVRLSHTTWLWVFYLLHKKEERATPLQVNWQLQSSQGELLDAWFHFFFWSCIGAVRGLICAHVYSGKTKNALWITWFLFKNNKWEIVGGEVTVPGRLNEFLQLWQSNNRTHIINSDYLYLQMAFSAFTPMTLDIFIFIG